MKLKINRNLGAGWPQLVEGQVVESGKDIELSVAQRLADSGWLAEVLPEPPKAPEVKSEPPEVKAVEPVTKPAGKNPVVSKPGK